MMATVQDLVPTAVAQALESEGGGIVTSVIVVAEAILEDGQHHLLTLADEDLSTWRKMGMLHGAMEDEKARHSADVLVDRLEGDD